MREQSDYLTRRSVLKAAGFLAAAEAVPPWIEPASAQLAGKAPDVTGPLTSYMSEAGDRPLPADVVAAAKEHILDTFAAMISGADLAPARMAIRFAHSYCGEKVATVVGSEILCGPVEAAIANAMLAHSDETDDSHSPSHSHPGCSVIPAALATGEKFRISGERFLRSVVLGYDVGPRVTMSLGGLRYQMSSHRSAHSIAGTFGASAAAACAAALNAQQMRWVLDYAAQQASGIAAWQRDTQHIEKSLVFGGFPARNGVTAALLIQLGASGVEDIFAGPDNFFAASGADADPTALIDQLGLRYEIVRTNIKKWTVGSPIQAPLDALQFIKQEHRFDSHDVKSVTVRMAIAEAKTVNDRNMPDISLQQMIAVMLVDGTVSFRAAHDQARMQDPVIGALRARIKLIGDEQLDKLYPKLVAVVDVTLKDGSQYQKRVDAVRGTVLNPMSRDEVESKARDLITPFLGEHQTDRLIQAISELERLPDIRRLSPLLQRSSG